MNEPARSEDASLPLSAALRVDAIAYRFEQAWKAAAAPDQRPRIADYLADAPEADRTTLLAELIVLDIAYRRRAAEVPQPDDYLGRFPSLDPAWLRRHCAAPGASPEIPADRTDEHVPAPDGLIAGPESGPPSVQVPGYEVLGKLGAGGMGVVYKARQIAADRLVALKMILHGIHAGDDSLTRFRTEARAIARLQHPNIVQIHEVGESDGLPYFSLEFCSGGSLDKKLAGTPLPAKEAARLVETLARAMHAAHREQIIHRDLKPANVLLTAEGTPKVTDFGLAKKIDQAGQTQTGAIMGTPSYMAPEQAAGQTKAIGPAADGYALGAILYECLTGRPPFKAATVPETLLQVLYDEPVPPRQLQSTTPKDLETICLKCLHKEPAKRYATTEALAADLRCFQVGEPIHARPVGRVERFWRWCLRHPAVAGLSAAVLSLLVAVAVVASIGYVREAALRTTSETARDRAEKAEGVATERLEEVTRQKQRTEEEAAIARAVNEFLQQDLLGQADIGNQPLLAGAAERNRNITVGELLDRAAQGIEGKFAGQPLTEAAIRLTLGETYRALGRYAEAQPHLERSVRLRTDRLGPSHPDTLLSQNQLAVLHYRRGKYDQAKTLYQEAIDGFASQLGADHPHTLTTKNNLAMLCKAQAKYGQAERLYQEVLAARTAQLGADHPHTLTSKNNLAVLYQAQGKYGQAERLYQEVLAARTAQLGADHPSTLTSTNNLARLYQAQGKYDRAEPLFQEALDTSTDQLGADHPNTLQCKNDLAGLYQHQGKYDQAEALFQEVLEARTAQLGADHPDTLTSKNGLALLYYSQGKYDRAEALYREAINASGAKLGADHPSTLTTKHNLALLYLRQRKYAQAEPLLKETLAGRSAQLGVDHPDTLASKNNLAGLYHVQRKYDLAASLYQEVLDAFTAQLGADHPDTLTSKHNLANLYKDQGKYDRAEPLHQEVLAGRTARLGAGHPSTLNTKNNLAMLYEAQGKYDRAESLLQEVLNTRATQLRADHPDTLNTKNNLAALYQAQGKYDRAETLYKEVLEAHTAKLGDDHAHTLLSKNNLAGLYLAQGPGLTQTFRRVNREHRVAAQGVGP
jgi:tetratricopeptide (TPR) repeat protein